MIDTIWLMFVYLLVMAFWLSALAGIALASLSACWAVFRWAFPRRATRVSNNT